MTLEQAEPDLELLRTSTEDDSDDDDRIDAWMLEDFEDLMPQERN
jgi:hypothetical protein